MIDSIEVVSFAESTVNQCVSTLLHQINVPHHFLPTDRWLLDKTDECESPCLIILDSMVEAYASICQRIVNSDWENILIIRPLPDVHCDAESDELISDEVIDESINNDFEVHSIVLDMPTLREKTYALIQRHMQRKKTYYNRKAGHLLGQKMIGDSAALTDVVEMVKKVANTDAGVYIHGETGTGKELAARSIHYLSTRSDGPFIPVNCGALSNELMLSELFGHEKGAFTGANKNHIGLIEQANEGTLFLDEVDSLSDKAQVTLLRFIQEQEFRSVGSGQIKYSNARIIVASNSSLEDLAKAGKFRMDLFFRLDILRIDLPPLRERNIDYFLLSQFFLRKHRDKFGVTKVLHPKVLQWMAKHPWPGNIRELDNFIHRAYLLSEGETISTIKGISEEELQHLDSDILEGDIKGLSVEKDKVLKKFEKQYIVNVLTKTQGNISSAAKLAEKERSSFFRLMKKHGIDRSQFTVEAS